MKSGIHKNGRKKKQNKTKKSCKTRYQQKQKKESYKRITWLLESQVTWNQVQGLTRVGSQLCNTFVGSKSLLLKACNAFPGTKTKKKEKKPYYETQSYSHTQVKEIKLKFEARESLFCVKKSVRKWRSRVYNWTLNSFSYSWQKIQESKQFFSRPFPILFLAVFQQKNRHRMEHKSMNSKP